MLLNHLVIDGVQVFRTAENTEFQVLFLQHGRDFLNHMMDSLITLCLLHLNELCNSVVLFPVQIIERKIFQFILDGTDAKTVGNWGIDIQRFSRNPLLGCLRLILQGPHVMKAVSQLNNNYPDVLCHRNKDLAVIACLIFRIILSLVFQGANLGNSFHKVGNFFIKFLCKFFLCDTGILDRIVQKAGSDGLRTSMQCRQNIGNVNQMDNIRLAGFAELPGMMFRGIVCCMRNQSKILRIGNVGLCIVHDILNTNILMFSHIVHLPFFAKNRREALRFV